MNVGEIIKQLREKHNITQAKLSEKAKVSQQYISAVECGILNPSIKNYKRLLNALNYEIYLRNTHDNSISK